MPGQLGLDARCSVVDGYTWKPSFKSALSSACCSAGWASFVAWHGWSPSSHSRKMMADTQIMDQALVQAIARRVFEVIVDQSSFVPNKMVEKQRTKVCDPELSKEEISEKEVTSRKANKKKTALGKHHSRKDSITDAGEKNSCGTCEDPGSLLQFDHKANRLLEITSRKNIPPFNQKCLSKLIKKFQDFSEGTLSRFDFDENISAGEDEQPNSQGQNKKKGNKPSVQTHLGKEKGNKSLHVEEESGGSTQKRKRKKKKKNRLQPENLSSGDKAMSSNQNESNEPKGKKRKTQKVLSVAETEAEASSTVKQGGLVHAPTMLTCNKKKRPKKKILRVRQKVPGLVVPPPKDTVQSGPSSDHAQEPSTHSPSEGGFQVMKKKRKLGALPVNGNSLSVLAWSPSGKESLQTNPKERKETHCPLTQRLKKRKKKGTPGSLDVCDLYDLPNPKATVLRKRKREKEMPHLVEHNGALDMEVNHIHALGNGEAFSPLKKKQKVKAENDFVKFDTPFTPKPLFFRKARSTGSISFMSPTVQLNKIPSSSKKVTFGLNRNMTAEFRKTDKSILVSPTGPFRVAFNPELRPLHGILKTPTSSPCSTPVAPKKVMSTPPPKKRPTAMDFF
ncbi:PREDICTED: ribosomal RNA processing protein 1 homolog B-like [Elephantulus edwardii]|uniref:ribosomal RNA processing protein 1 homolog B-like n=1 Tax=Elephantulus edwardii TaxID=28737 RepID=UPI0003F0E794|nr:PREDICTED: ribosomal RNA processing protein 1 homolog B-like [Elephantulus edwardii]